VLVDVIGGWGGELAGRIPGDKDSKTTIRPPPPPTWCGLVLFGGLGGGALLPQTNCQRISLNHTLNNSPEQAVPLIPCGRVTLPHHHKAGSSPLSYHRTEQTLHAKQLDCLSFLCHSLVFPQGKVLPRCYMGGRCPPGRPGPLLHSPQRTFPFSGFLCSRLCCLRARAASSVRVFVGFPWVRWFSGEQRFRRGGRGGAPTPPLDSALNPLP